MRQTAHTLASAWLVLLAAAPGAARAADRGVKLAVVHPGGGFLVSDGASVLPLEILVSGPEGSKPTRAKVTARHGKALETHLIEDSVSFLYQVPKSSTAVNETLEVALGFAEGDITEKVGFKVPAPSPPKLELTVDPPTLTMAQRDENRAIRVDASATGADVQELVIIAAPGEMGPLERTRDVDRVRASASVTSARLPKGEPSCVLAVAAATSPLGFAARSSPSVLEASIQVEVDIPAKSELVIEGAANEPPPAVAGADGHVIVDDVVVRYGAQVRAFSRRGGKKTEVSVAIPSHLSPGLVLPIPGQDVADGGTGATLLVAVPPSPFGEAVIWPEIQVEGAEVTGTVKLADDLRVLVLRRPDAPGTVSVLLDDQRVAQLFFGGQHGVSVELVQVKAKPGERGAIEVLVTDARGNPSEAPVPLVRVGTGAPLELEHVGPGKYRTAIVPSLLPADASTAPVIAELTPPRLLTGATLEGAQATTTVQLAPIVAETKPPEVVEDGGDHFRFAMGATALVGRTLTALTVLGGGVLGELRFPVLGGRIGLRAGATYARSSGTGIVEYAESNAASATIAGLWVPFDLGFAVVSGDAFELAIRGGATLRFERGALVVDGDVTAGGSRFAIGGMASTDAAFTLGPGAFFLEAAVDGIGTRADGLASQGRAFRGALTAVRGDFGYKLWF